MVNYCGVENSDVVDWWNSLEPLDDVGLSGSGPVSGNGDNVYLFGWFEDKYNAPTGSKHGAGNINKGKKIIFPTVNGKYCEDEIEEGKDKPKFMDSLYARIVQFGPGGIQATVVPQSNRISLQFTEKGCFYYGQWVCIESDSLPVHATIQFGGSGYKSKHDSGALFETSASWQINAI